MISETKIKYRDELDGLRALAIISVVLYHSGLQIADINIFRGGYIGVDIFFVLSGYLISKQIIFEIENTGKINLLNFYFRRLRRIIPALFLVISICFLCSWIILLPSNFVDFAYSAISSIGFFSNAYFFFSQIEYEAKDALLIPLLHTWSLSVEEQFYIIFPFVLLILSKTYWAKLGQLICTLCLASFALALTLQHEHSVLNFYLSLTRFWEILVGTLVVLLELKLKPKHIEKFSGIGSVFGLILIISSLLIFRNETPHPSLITTLPVFGTALLIIFLRDDIFLTRLVSFNFLTFIGKISYSLYLWHYPVMAFSRLNDPTPSTKDRVEWILVSIALAVATYFLVEVPCRKTQFSKQKIVLYLAPVSLLLAVSIIVVFQDGFRSRFEKHPLLANFELDNDFLAEETMSFLNLSTFSDSKINLLFVGNSHSIDTFNAFFLNEEKFEEFGLKKYPKEVQFACLLDEKGKTKKKLKAFFNSKEVMDSDILVVSTRFQKRTCGNELPIHDLDGLKDFLKFSSNIGKPVIVFGNTPEFKNIGNRLISDDYFLKISRTPSVSKQTEFQELREKINKDYFILQNPKIHLLNLEIEEITLNHGFLYLDKVRFLCSTSKQSCTGITKTGFKVFYDYGHYTLAGAKLFGMNLATSDAVQAIKKLASAKALQ